MGKEKQTKNRMQNKREIWQIPPDLWDSQYPYLIYIWLNTLGSQKSETYSWAIAEKREW